MGEKRKLVKKGGGGGELRAEREEREAEGERSGKGGELACGREGKTVTESGVQCYAFATDAIQHLRMQ